MQREEPLEEAWNRRAGERPGGAEVIALRPERTPGRPRSNRSDALRVGPEARRLVFAISFGAALASGAMLAAQAAAERLDAASSPAPLAARVAKIVFPVAAACAVMSSRSRLRGSAG